MGSINQQVDYLHLPKGTILNNKYLIKDRLVPKSNLSIIYRAVNFTTKENIIIKEFFPQKLALRDLDGKTLVSKTESNQDLLEDEIKHFLKEGTIMKELKDCPIGRCYDFFRENNTGYIVLKYYQGQNLEEYLQENSLNLEQFLKQIFYPLLKIVERVHNKGYLHRDLKPANIMYTNKVVLIDFGSAIRLKQKKSNKRVLTPGYSPLEFYSTEAEQNVGSDIYSLTAILYYYLTSQVPIAAKQRVIEDELPSVLESNSTVTEGLKDFIIRNLSLNLEYRDKAINKFRLNLELEYLKIKSKRVLNYVVTNFLK